MKTPKLFGLAMNLREKTLQKWKVLLASTILMCPRLFPPRKTPLQFPNLPVGCGMSVLMLFIQIRVILVVLTLFAPSMVNDMIILLLYPLIPRLEHLNAEQSSLQLKGQSGPILSCLQLWQLINMFLPQAMCPRRAPPWRACVIPLQQSFSAGPLLVWCLMETGRWLSGETCFAMTLVTVRLFRRLGHYVTRTVPVPLLNAEKLILLLSPMIMTRPLPSVVSWVTLLDRFLGSVKA